ncbi:MAG: hypothetical protein WBC44_14595 [Planctomycetaceae bacterium]
MKIDLQTLLLAGVIAFLAVRGCDRADPGPQPEPLNAAAVEAGRRAVEVFRTQFADALDEQAAEAEAGRFGSKGDFARFLEPQGDAAWAAAQDAMSPVVQEQLAGEWDARKAAAVSRGLAAGLRKD